MHKKLIPLQFLLLFITSTPVFVAGGSVSEPSNFKDVIMIAVNLVTAVLPVIVLIAFIYVLWGLAQYLRETGENRDDARHIITSGLIGFFAISSVWGLVTLLVATLGTQSSTKIPDLPNEAETYFSGSGVSDSGANFQDSLFDDRDHTWDNYPDDPGEGFE